MGQGQSNQRPKTADPINSVPNQQRRSKSPIQQKTFNPYKKNLANVEPKVEANMQTEYYNDDEKPNMKAQNAKYEKIEEPKIEISLLAQRTMAKLKQKVQLPAMCSVKSSGGTRSSVDLICVIDVSGSMRGNKINLVKQTMKYLLQTLTAGDRLSIISFQSYGKRICPLKCVTSENLLALNSYVDSLNAGGGTNINSGLDIALKTIRDRKHQNNVTSIFLLSDGQDKGAQNEFKKRLQLPQNKQDLGVFSLHSFGFGADHDEDLMTKLCTLKDGNFYFIKQLETLDQAFANALGGIISVVASEVTIRIKNIAQNIVQNVKINRTFGTMFEKINQREYRIKLLQMMSGISKDFVFQIGIPYINTEVGDLDRDHNVIEASFQAKGFKGQKMSGQCILKLTLLNQNEQIPETNQNPDVVQNYLRVKASQAIEQNLKLAQQNNFEQAQKGIDLMINDIKSNKRARKDKVDNLVNDLEMIRNKCSAQDYHSGGRKEMKRAQWAHQQQKAFDYSNKMQCEMVLQRKARKM